MNGQPRRPGTRPATRPEPSDESCPALQPGRAPDPRTSRRSGARAVVYTDRRDDGRDRPGGYACDLQGTPSMPGSLQRWGATRPRDRFWMDAAWRPSRRWGWIEPLHMNRVEEQLLLAWLLDSVEVGAVAKVWAAIGRHPDRLVPVGDAPNWTGRAEGLKRWTEGRAVNADPWRLFPAWLRDQLPVPPGDATPKMRENSTSWPRSRPGRHCGSPYAAKTKNRSGTSSGMPS